MSRPREKNSVPCAFRLDATLVAKLHAFSTASKISQTALVELALEQFFETTAPTLAKNPK